MGDEMNGTAGRQAYEAYGRQVGGKTHDGRDIPAWDDLGDTIRGGWEAAALAGHDALAGRGPAVPALEREPSRWKSLAAPGGSPDVAHNIADLPPVPPVPPPTEETAIKGSTPIEVTQDEGR